MRVCARVPKFNCWYNCTCAILSAAYPSPALLSGGGCGGSFLVPKVWTFRHSSTCRWWTPCTIPANQPPSRRGWPVSNREPGNAVRPSPRNRRHPISTPTETPIRRWPDRGAQAGAPVCIYLVAERHSWIAQGRGCSRSITPPTCCSFYSFLQPNPQSLFVCRSRLSDRQDFGVPIPALTGSRLV